MATRTWNGATGDWTVDANWLPATSGNDVPLPGDTAVVTAGTVILTSNLGPNTQFDNNTVTLGGSATPTLLLRDSLPVGRFYNVTIAGSATIEADGVRGFAGSISGAPNDGSTVTIKADPGGELVLLRGGTFNVTDRTIVFEGNVTLERDANPTGNIVNNGTLSVRSGNTNLVSNSVTGTGTIKIGTNGTLTLPGPIGAGQTIAFDGTGGTLAISLNNSGTLNATITNFAPGDFIDFVPLNQVLSASLDTTLHRLTISEGGSQAYVFNNVFGQAGALSATRQTNGHWLIGYASAEPRVSYQIDAGARAMNVPAARTLFVPGTTVPITGAGVKVGIISDSYNVLGKAADDVRAGYLPASGVTMLRERATGGTDEGRAMAELVHLVAPDASLYFASAGAGIDDFTASVRALQAAGCSVIVDDIGLTGAEPFFQLGDPLENAIADAIAGGVTYVSSAGNYGKTYFDHVFTSTSQTLLDGSVVPAFTFSNGTPYQSITVSGGISATIDLQWDAPFYGVGGTATDQPYSIAFKVFNATSNTLIGTSYQVSLGGHLVSEAEFGLPFRSSSTEYRIAIYQNDPSQTIGRIKYVLGGVNSTGGGSVAGRINDPEAGVGSGVIEGHALIPGVVTVAAADVTNTPAFGASPSFAEYFTSAGPGTLLFDQQGNRLASPVEAGAPDVTGPDGIYTSVTNFTPFFGTSASAPNVAGVAALMLQANPGLSPAMTASILAQSARPLSAQAASTSGAGLVQADRAVTLAEQVACYCVGTLIATDCGERPVEALEIGDRVLTAAGVARPIRWIGRRSYSRQFLWGRAHLLPVRFRAGALAEGVPYRDLWVSPQHAMLLDGMLIPAVLLVNGRSIVQEPHVDEVSYVHLELDSHDVILAEGAPSETFLDDGSRGMFHNAAEHHLLYPDAAAVPPRYCAPRVEDGIALEAVRTRLRALAEGGRDPRGPLQGCVDEALPDRVRGWARDVADPDQPVWLQVFDNGMPVAIVRASDDRPDVREAGLGDGRCGFEVSVPGGFAPGTDHRIEVRRATDGAPLGQARRERTAVEASAPVARGTLDQADRTCVRGWVQDEADPGAPVMVEILCNGQLIGQALANRLRPDLTAAGIGDGRHAFEFEVPPAVAALETYAVEVRCVRDGRPLAGSPAIVGPAARFDRKLQQEIDGSVAGLLDPDEQERVLSFMVAQTDRLLQRRADAGSGRSSRDMLRQFRRRWGTAEGAAPDGCEAGTALKAPGLRALVIDETMPVAGRDAGSEAILSHMRALQSLGYEVSLVAAGLEMPQDAVPGLAACGVLCCGRPFYASVEDVLRRQADCFDVIYLHREAVASRYLALARSYQPRARVLYSVADLHHLRLMRQAAVEDRPELLALSRRVRLAEFTAAWMADAVITHSAAEAALLRAAVPEASVHLVPWDQRPVPRRTAWQDRAGVAFIGSYGHAPNRDAARWLVESVMPLVWRCRPEIGLLLVGSQMPQAIRDLARPGVEAVGAVAMLGPAVFDRVRLTVAPLRYGAGLKGKVLDSLAAGVPCAMSGIAAEGMALPPALHGLVMPDAAGLAALICRLHDDEAANAGLAEAGLAWIGQAFDARTVETRLQAAIGGERHSTRSAAG